MESEFSFIWELVLLKEKTKNFVIGRILAANVAPALAKYLLNSFAIVILS